MSKPEIIIDFDEGGEPTISVEGCPGPKCKDLTAALEKALGTTTSDTPTKEMQQRALQGQQAKAGAR